MLIDMLTDAECDIRIGCDTNEYLNIFVYTKEYPNIFVSKNYTNEYSYDCVIGARLAFCRAGQPVFQRGGASKCIPGVCSLLTQFYVW